MLQPSSFATSLVKLQATVPLFFKSLNSSRLKPSLFMISLLNDKVDTYFKYCVMRYKKDPRKLYRPMIDFVAYDPQYFINEINSIMNYVNTQSKDKKTDLANMKQSIMDNIDKGFEQYHGFVDECEPIMKVETIRGIRLEDAINKFKTYISNIYKMD